MQSTHPVSSVSETDSKRQPITEIQAVKPLPPLPRGWSRICHETSLFLRGIGLGIVVASFQGFFTKEFFEPKKVAIRRSRITALLRTLIHAAPVGVAIWEIVFNLKGHFVGSTFNTQNYLQFAAKAHEIAMQASISTVLFSYIRYQMSTGKGIPFGAVFGGLQFLQVSYLWSVELWSSILSKDFQLRQKACFALLILICVTVAATAGPSSANLLIPRQGLWSTPSSYFAVNASDLEMWPELLDGKDIERDCAMVRFDSLKTTVRCPLSDLYILLQANQLGSSIIEAPIPFSLDMATIPCSGTNFTRTIISSICPTTTLQSSRVQYCATVPRTELLGGYFSSLSNHFDKDHFPGYQIMQKNYYQPYTIASCVADVVQDAFDQAPLRFARISETESELNNDRQIVSIPGLTKGHVVDNMSGDNSDFRVDWVDLPMDVINTGIPGAVIVTPRGSNSSSYNITTCTLNAGWGSSTILTSSQESSCIYSHMSYVPSFWSKLRGVIDAYGYIFSDAPNFSNISNFPYPQRRISVSKNWMEFLNPNVVLANNSTGKLISLALLSLQPRLTETMQPTEEHVARLLNLLLATAIGDTRTERDTEVFSDLKTATTSCDTCLMFEIEYAFYGWSYSASGTATILSITVMLTYCVLVFGHIIYSAIYGISSTAWDSAAELVALAMNSSPTEVLQNTCAGIIGRQALNTTVRVLATTPGHLELVFGEVKDPNVQTSELVMNQKYGKLPGENDNEVGKPASSSEGQLRKRAAAQSSE